MLPERRTLFAARPLIRVTIGPMEVQMRSYRTMGKMVWPAAHALANLFGARLCGGAMRPCVERCSLLEFGAGAGVPSIVAARSGWFDAVLATDFTEEGVELLRHNDQLNGAPIRGIERLDVSERGALAKALERHAIAPHQSLLLLAADMSYDPDAIANLFAEAAHMLSMRPSAPFLLCFARSDKYAGRAARVRSRPSRSDGRTLHTLRSAERCALVQVLRRHAYARLSPSRLVCHQRAPCAQECPVCA